MAVNPAIGREQSGRSPLMVGVPHLSNHGLGQNLGSPGATQKVGGFEEDLCAVLGRPPVPFLAGG